jgi:hypothetical protein
MQLQQLQPGKGLDALERAQLTYLDQRVRLDSARQCLYRYDDLLGSNYGDNFATGAVELPLWRWCSDI